MSKDFYSVLSLPRNAKPAEIKERFRELARERHPDRFQGEEKIRAELEFQNLTEALNVLMDPIRRRQHDLELDQPGQLVHDPGDAVRVYMSRGIRAYKRGTYPEAAANFERAAESNPENAQAWHHLALTCLKDRRWLVKGQQAIAKALELRPSHVPYLKLAGKIYADSGMIPRARQYYNQALQSSGPDPSIRRALEALDTGHAAAADNRQGGAGRPRKVK